MKDETLASIGHILTKPMMRDAVHIAVVQAKCPQWTTLKPGQHVYIGGDMEATPYNYQDKTVGIVDPYLTEDVKTGESCWVFLYPGTITDLKHVWTHPDIPDIKMPHPSGLSFGDAEQILRGFAEEWNVTEFHELLDAIAHHTGTGIPSVSISVQNWSDISPAEYRSFWDAAEVYFDDNFSKEHRDGTYFQCCA